MTKNILVIGCSFSRAFSNKDDSLDRKISWPELLARQNRDYNVYNAAQYCMSIPAQWATLEHILLHFHDQIDTVILQFTTIHRLTIIEDWYKYLDNLNIKNFMNSIHGTKNYFQLPEQVVNPNLNLLGIKHLNPAQLPKRWKKTYEDCLLYELGMYGMLSQQFCQVIQDDMKNLVEKYNIPCISYKHYNDKNTTKENYLELGQNERDRKNLDFVLQYEMEFDKYVVDDGFHFGYEGNEIIVNDFIMPLLEKKLNNV